MESNSNKKREYPKFTEGDYNTPEWKAAVKRYAKLLREAIDEEIIQSVIKEAKKNESKQ
jgi:hypothetical protein